MSVENTANRSPDQAERPSDIVDLPPTDRVDFIERAWRFFCSTKLMVVLMALFSLAMAAGTFLNPQEDALAEIERSFAGRPFVLWAYRSFELYAPFKSWWFTTIILLLGLNNLASSIERLPRIFLIVRNPERKLTDRLLRGIRNKRTLPEGSADATSVRAAFEKSGYRVQRIEEDGATYLFGERGAWTRFGVWVVHLALLVICFGGIVGRLFAFEGTMDLPENGGTQAFFRERMPDGTILRHPLPGFALRCNNFDLDKFKDGSARRFASDLAVLDAAGRVIHEKRIIVNDPLRWEGMDFYQATYQERPDQSHAAMTLVDKETGLSKDFRATPSEPFFLGDGSVRFTVANYEPAFGELGPAVQIVREEGPAPGSAEFEKSQPKVSSFWVFQNYPDFDGKFRGDRFGLRFDKLQPLYITGIQVAYDPGVIWIYAGCFFMWAGLFVTFWTVHRRVWARIENGKVVVAGAAHRNKERFKEEFDHLVEQVAAPSAPVAQ